MLTDVLEIGLEDSQLLAEIRLVTELMIAATAAPGALEQDTIDRLLGVRPGVEVDPPQVVDQVRRGD
jgi:hypothetical protein